MIPARPSPLFRAWFTRHARARLRARFGAVRIEGLDHLAGALARGPVLVVANHVAWWDPLVALVLTQLLGAEGRALMDARNLRRLPFFRLVGAFGVDLGDPRDGALALREAARHLDRPGHLVWIFPQGRERPEDPRPLGFLPGAAALARRARGAATVPVALRYAFAAEEAPVLLIAVGPPLPAAPDGASGCRAQEDAVAALLDGLQARLSQGRLAELPALWAPRRDRLGALMERALAALVGAVLGRR